MVPTGTGNQGKPGKMGRHFPVREKSGNFVKTGKVRKKSENFAQNTGKTGKLKKKMFFCESQGILHKMLENQWI